MDLGANTDWFKEITRTGISSQSQSGVIWWLNNGGYRASLNYLSREGVMKDNHLQKYNGLISINQKALKDRLNITLVAGTVQSDFQPTNTYNTTLAYNMLPVYPVKKG
ncbi:MAG: hypothetical protein HC905_03895 [Bacteroidales bacterium]|nr:hypothetical protein [Bacteroidales bacterium]